MKCIPITCAGRRVRAAISVMEIELVLVARIASGGAAPSSCSKTRELDRRILARRLDHQARVVRRLELRWRLMRPRIAGASVGRDRALLHLAVEISADGGHRLIERRWRRVDERNVPAVLSEHVGDAVAHGAGPDDGGAAHVVSFPAQRTVSAMARARASVASKPAFWPELAARQPRGLAGMVVQQRDAKRQAADRRIERGERRIPAEMRSERGPETAGGVECHAEEEPGERDVAERKRSDVRIEPMEERECHRGYQHERRRAARHGGKQDERDAPEHHFLAERRGSERRSRLQQPAPRSPPARRRRATSRRFPPPLLSREPHRPPARRARARQHSADASRRRGQAERGPIQVQESNADHPGREAEPAELTQAAGERLPGAGVFSILIPLGRHRFRGWRRRPRAAGRERQTGQQKGDRPSDRLQHLTRLRRWRGQSRERTAGSSARMTSAARPILSRSPVRNGTRP